MAIVFIALGIFLGIVLILSAVSYRALFFPHFRSAEYTKTRGLERGEFDEAFLALPWRDFQVESARGYTIAGSYLASGQKEASTALFIHGITWTRFGMLKYMKVFAGKGWNVASIDLAGHGDTRAPRRFGPSYGFYEKEDAAVALGALEGLFPDTGRIGLVGESLGAASVLQCLGLPKERLPCPPCFVIADCPFSDIGEELDHRLARLWMPRCLRAPVEFCVSWLTRIVRGFALKDASSMEAALSSEIPILFIHGIDDGYVPCGMSIKMYNERKKSGKSATELLLVPGAKHAKSFLTDPELWTSSAFSFIERYSREGKRSPISRTL